jgi:hypothetical protein
MIQALIGVLRCPPAGLPGGALPVARVSSRAAIASSMVLYLRFKMLLLFRSMRTNHLLFDAIHWMWRSRCLGSLGGPTGAPQHFARDPLDLEGTARFFCGPRRNSGSLSAITFTPIHLRRRSICPPRGSFCSAVGGMKNRANLFDARDVRFHGEPQAYRRCY